MLEPVSERLQQRQHQTQLTTLRGAGAKCALPDWRPFAVRCLRFIPMDSQFAGKSDSSRASCLLVGLFATTKMRNGTVHSEYCGDDVSKA